MPYDNAAITAAAGIVRTHAQTIRPATPHLTADKRFAEPTPTSDTNRPSDRHGDHVIPLIMMAENDDTLAQFFSLRLDPLMDFRVGHYEIIFKCLCVFGYGWHHFLQRKMMSF